MTEFVQATEVSRLSVESCLAGAREALARFYVTDEQRKDFAAAGVTVLDSPGYLQSLFAPKDAEGITPGDRLVDMYVSSVALGLSETAETAAGFLRGVYAEPKLAQRLSDEIRHYMGAEKRHFGKYDNPRWERLRTARRQLSHTDVLISGEQVEARKPLRGKIVAAAGRLSLGSSES
jgi:hypothetical protein